MNHSMTVVASYDASNASVRARVMTWLNRANWKSEKFFFVQDSSNNSKTLLRNIQRIPRSYRALHELVKHPGEAPLMLQRRASPLSNGNLESKLLRSATVGIYDFDDAIFLREAEGMQRFWSEANVCKMSVVAADRVIVGNGMLADWASQFSSNVHVIPTCVEPEEYLAKKDFEIYSHPRAIWVGSPSTERYFRDISQALIEVNKATGLRLTVVSAGNASLGPLEEMTDRMDWDESISLRIADYDFAISPLRDDAWSRGKCSYKLLQYGAAAIPTISSPVGVNADVSLGFGHPSAISLIDWSDAMNSIIEASKLERQEMGERARNFVDLNFSFKSWEPAWHDVCSLY
jgi:hypothetical protein